MTENYFTPHTEASAYSPSVHNGPLGELDAQITANVAAIAALASRIEALEAQVFRASPSESPSVSPSSSESPSVSPSPSPS